MSQFDIGKLKKDVVLLNPHFKYHVDSLSEKGFTDIAINEYTSIEEEVMRVGADGSTIWLKLDLSNSSQNSFEGYIHFFDPSINTLIMYRDGKEYTSGVGVTQSNKAVKGNRHAFYITLAADESESFYFKLHSYNKMTLNVHLKEASSYLDEIMVERFTLGLFYGCMLLAFVYSIILLVATRLRMFAYYSAFIFFVALLCGAGDGITAELFHGWVEWKQGYQDAAAAAIANILSLMFMLLFLDVKRWSTFYYRLTAFFMLIPGVISVVLIQLEHLAIFDFLGASGLLQTFLIILVSIQAVRNRVPQASYFLVAYLVFGSFVTLFILNLFRLVPYNFWSQYAIHLGYGFSVMILSYGLGRRIYSFYTALLEKEQEQQLIIKSKNEELERQVKERTDFLNKKEGDLRSIIDNHDNNIWLIDSEYKVIDFNSVFAHDWEVTYGVKLKLGTSIIDQTPIPNLKTKWKIRYDLALEGKAAEYNDEYVMEGVTRIFNIKTFPIFEQGKVRGVSVFASDITEQVSVQRKLEGQNKMLKKVNQELDSFVYSASHDLKAPLASMLGLIELSKMEPDKEEQKKYFEMMERSINRLDQFIRDIIDYSRNARTSPEHTIVNIKELLDSVIQDLKYVFPENKVIPKISIDQKSDLILDETRLKVIVRNLISNALKYGCLKEADNIIEIAADINEKRIYLSIKDFGPGIKKEYQGRIFDMFFRAQEETQGTGLGLYIVKETINKMNGRITLESGHNSGATFIVEIPNHKVSNP